MENIRLTISRLLLIGIVVSFTLIISGGVLYLYQHGHETVYYQHFYSEPILLTSFTGIFQDAADFSSQGVIQLGLLVLLIVQVLRVALTGWFFLKVRNFIFTWMTAGILIVLLATLIVSM